MSQKSMGADDHLSVEVINEITEEIENEEIAGSLESFFR